MIFILDRSFSGITLNNEIIREIIQEAEASDERVIKALLKDLCVKDIAILPEVLQLIKTTYEKTFPSAASDVVVELVKLNESRVFAAAPKVDSDLSTSPSKPHSSGVVYQLFQACETSDVC